jgi:hypothetical protein
MSVGRFVCVRRIAYWTEADALGGPTYLAAVRSTALSPEAERVRRAPHRR